MKQKPYKRIHLWRPDANAAVTDKDLVRRAAVAIADDLTGGREGRLKGDPIYEWVATNGLSGALPYAVLQRLGFREPRFVRDLFAPTDFPWCRFNPYELAYLANAYKNAWVWPGAVMVPEPGDIVLMDYKPEVAEAKGYHGAHLCVVKSYTGEKMVSFDYGQYSKKYQVPMCRERERKLVRPFDFGEHRVMGWVDITALPMSLPAAVPESFVGGTPPRIVTDDFKWLEHLAEDSGGNED